MTQVKNSFCQNTGEMTSRRILIVNKVAFSSIYNVGELFKIVFF